MSIHSTPSTSIISKMNMLLLRCGSFKLSCTAARLLTWSCPLYSFSLLVCTYHSDLPENEQPKLIGKKCNFLIQLTRRFQRKWTVQWVALKVHSVSFKTNEHESGSLFHTGCCTYCSNSEMKCPVNGDKRLMFCNHSKKKNYPNPKIPSKFTASEKSCSHNITSSANIKMY